MSKSEHSELREIKIQGNESQTSSIYPGNTLKLSKYTWFSLIPKNLFEQFQRTTNIWFLIVAIFQLIPTESNPTDSWNTILPLSVLLFVTLAKDTYRDYNLKILDRQINQTLYLCWNGSYFVEKQCQNIIMGDIVIVNESQVVPADVLLLNCSGYRKTAFSDICKLVGQTGLQQIKAVDKDNKMIVFNEKNEPKVSARLNCVVKISEPSFDYNSFEGRIKLVGDPGHTVLRLENLMFKGSVLKGVDQAVCLALYCGFECKIQLNTNKIALKTSNLEKKTNHWAFYILCTLCVLVFFSVIGFYFYNNYGTNQYNLLDPIVSFTLLYNNIIPISLYMVIDIIRVIQTFMMKKSIEGINLNTERVNEDLGQADYILCDKTGTITEGSLSVKVLMIENQRFFMKRNSKCFIDTDVAGNDLERSPPRVKEEIDDVETLKSQIKNQNYENNFNAFMQCMALCHSLTLHNNTFFGSQDEIELVEATKKVGYNFSITNSNVYRLEINDIIHEYEVLATRPFNPNIKKSRVLVKEKNQDYGILYVKGDPYFMKSLLNKTYEEKQEIVKSCNEFNKKGLRTMILACKKVDLEDIFEFHSKIKKLEHSLLNNESRIESMFREIEKNLEYLGVTCIEEEISQDTIDTISVLKQSNIKLWMLSGDSFGNTNFAGRLSGIIESNQPVITLSNISDKYTCLRILKELINQHVFNEHKINRTSGAFSHQNFEGSESIIEENTLTVNNQRSNHALKRLSNIVIEDTNFDNKCFDPSELDFSICIDKTTLNTALNDEFCRRIFIPFVVAAKSVCFCGLIPKDKGNIVKFLKENVKFKPVVLAIGDGDGDISMLQTANVGISVNTLENSVLKNFSDISLSSFSDLKELVLVQGHWNYYRLSKSILLFLYKNFFLTLLLLAYTFQCSYSGTSLFNSSLLVGYNIVFTTLPIIVIGVFDENISRRFILQHPEVYVEGIKSSQFNRKKIGLYCFFGIFQGVLLTVIVFLCVPQIIASEGRTLDLEILGTMIYITLILAVLIQIYLDTYCFNIYYLISQMLSVLFVMIFLIILNFFVLTDSNLIGIGSEIIMSPFSLFLIFFTSVICIVPMWGYYNYKFLFYPNLIDSIKSNSKKFFNKLDKFKKCFLSIYVQSLNWENNSIEEKYSMNKYTLRFNLKHIEKAFKDSFIIENLPLIKWTVFGIWLLVILWTILSTTLFNVSIDYALARIVISAGFGVIVYIIFTESFRKNFNSYVITLVFAGLLTKLALDVGFSNLSILATALVPSITYILLNVDWIYTTLLNVLNIVLLIISLSVTENDNSKRTSLQILEYLVLIISITITSAVEGYYLEIHKRTEFKLANLSSASIEKTQSILSLLFPPFVKNRIKEGVRYIAENQGEVTVLFCDICDFEDICKDYKPRELRNFLDSLFKIFDGLCESTGVVKIETVGKTYMACAGLHDNDSDLHPSLRKVHHAKRALELAFSMLQEVSHIPLKNENNLHVKIGINTGVVVAGVVGHHKPQFSLVGDTVNTASRMCSTLSQYNSVQISKATYEHLKHEKDVHFVENAVEAKGKGILQTFIAKEKRNQGPKDFLNSVDKVLQENSNKNEFSIYNDDSAKIENSHIEEEMIVTVNTKLSQSVTIRSILEAKLKQQNTGLISNTSKISNLFKEDKCEKEFRHSRLETGSNVIFFSLVVALVAFIIIEIFSISAYYVLNNYSNKAILIGRGIVILFLICIILVQQRIYKHVLYPSLIFMVLILMYIVSLFNYIYSTDVVADMIALQIMYIMLIIVNSTGAQIFLIILTNISIFVSWTILSLYSSNNIENITNLLLVAAFSIINFISILIQDSKHRKNFNYKIVANKEIKETENLLVQMMPAHILEELQNDNSVTDELENVSILFADIVGFTNWSSNKTPLKVVKMLSELFTSFDKLCIEFGVYKVHTIGDCYVVLGHTEKHNRKYSEECLNVIKMAESMVEIIEKQNKINGSSLNMRIGIHTGKVIAGVIGTNSVRYDIWGKDVLIANKMESSGTEGKIHVSENTKNLLQKHFSEQFFVTENKKVKIEALGKEIQTYFIDRKVELVLHTD